MLVFEMAQDILQPVLDPSEMAGASCFLRETIFSKFHSPSVIRVNGKAAPRRVTKLRRDDATDMLADCHDGFAAAQPFDAPRSPT